MVQKMVQWRSLLLSALAIPAIGQLARRPIERLERSVEQIRFVVPIRPELV
jgi:hypothetical protein